VVWTFRNNGNPFRFRGRIVGQLEELDNGLDDDCDGVIDDELREFGTGETCTDALDCNSFLCTGGTCEAGCADGMYGATCADCPGGYGVDQCNGNGSCADGPTGDGSCTCDAGFHASTDCVASCSDGAQNGDETGLDCGGAECGPCATGGMAAGGRFFALVRLPNGRVRVAGEASVVDAEYEYGMPHSDYTQLSAGYTIACGLRADGSIDCMSGNGPSYLDLAGGADPFTDIAVQEGGRCGLRASGAIVCNGNINGTTPAVPAGDPARIVHIDGGRFGLVGLRHEGRLQPILSNNETGFSSLSEFYAPPAGRTIASFSVGHLYTMAILDNGDVVRASGIHGAWPASVSGGADPFVELVTTPNGWCGLRASGAMDCFGAFTASPTLPSGVSWASLCTDLPWSERPCGISTDGVLRYWQTDGAFIPTYADAGPLLPNLAVRGRAVTSHIPRVAAGVVAVDGRIVVAGANGGAFGTVGAGYKQLAADAAGRICGRYPASDNLPPDCEAADDAAYTLPGLAGAWHIFGYATEIRGVVDVPHGIQYRTQSGASLITFGPRNVSPGFPYDADGGGGPPYHTILTRNLSHVVVGFGIFNDGGINRHHIDLSCSANTCTYVTADGRIVKHGGVFPVPAYDSNHPYVQVSNNLVDICGLRSNGTIVCGTGAPFSAGGPPGTRFIELARGMAQQHHCALRSDGALQCWGPPLDPTVNGVVLTGLRTFGSPTWDRSGQRRLALQEEAAPHPAHTASALEGARHVPFFGTARPESAQDLHHATARRPDDTAATPRPDARHDALRRDGTIGAPTISH
jgi:hypothetical protein